MRQNELGDMAQLGKVVGDVCEQLEPLVIEREDRISLGLVLFHQLFHFRTHFSKLKEVMTRNVCCEKNDFYV